MPENQRIKFLDGLRCVAILAVILFHYFCRWTPSFYTENLYPYGNLLAAPFQYGRYGVELFFIISGFVITLTLYRCSTFFEFAVRRFARLWPAMAISCLITYTAVHLIPNRAFVVSAASWIPSLTFSDPHTFNTLFHTDRFDWIDGAYWSLFAEVRFYILAGLVFFLRRDRFPRSICLVGIAVTGLSCIASAFHVAAVGKVLSFFFIADYLPWFLVGIAFFLLHKQIERKIAVGLFLVGILTLMARAIHHRSTVEAVTALLIPALFLAVSRTALLNRVVSSPLLTGIGAASYSLYLIHQNLGVALIGWLGAALHLAGPVSLVLPIFVALAIMLLSSAIYRWWEMPLNRKIVAMAAGRFSRPRESASDLVHVHLEQAKSGEAAAD